MCVSVCVWGGFYLDTAKESVFLDTKQSAATHKTSAAPGDGSARGSEARERNTGKQAEISRNNSCLQAILNEN